MQADSPQKKFFLATLRTLINYYTLITKTLINIRNTLLHSTPSRIMYVM